MGIHVITTTGVTGKTGIEMEALTAASVACLTIYDMCKAVDRGMEIMDVRLLLKDGRQDRPVDPRIGSVYPTAAGPLDVAGA